MNIKCKNCSPKEGIEIPDFSTVEKRQFKAWKKESPLHAVKNMMTVNNLSHRNAKYLVRHLNLENNVCHECNFEQLSGEYTDCPQCKALNLNWKNNLNQSKGI